MDRDESQCSMPGEVATGILREFREFYSASSLTLLVLCVIGLEANARLLSTQHSSSPVNSRDAPLPSSHPPHRIINTTDNQSLIRTEN